MKNRKSKKRRRFVQKAVLLLACSLLCGCGSRRMAESLSSGTEKEEIKREEVSLFAMDTSMTLTGFGDEAKEALAAAAAEISRLDELWSVGKESSEVYKLNLEKSAVLSEDTRLLYETSMELYEATDGAYDLTVYPLMEAWGFTTGSYSVPDEAKLNELLERLGCDRLTYDKASGLLCLDKGQGIDFGGIAKGYTSGRIMEIFSEYGLTSGFVSLGGNVQCLNKKPDGSLWRCGIANPDSDSGGYIGILSVENKAVITSGGYERYFFDEESKTTYHHILDPKTGYPADSGLISVTIVSENGMLADGLSTAVYILGPEQALKLWKSETFDFEMILMSKDREIYITEGLKDSFDSNYPVKVIGKEEGKDGD